MSILTQSIKDIKMIWMLGCLIISTFINHGVGFRFDKCDSIANTRVFNGNTAEKRNYFIKNCILKSQYGIDYYYLL